MAAAFFAAGFLAAASLASGIDTLSLANIGVTWSGQKATPHFLWSAKQSVHGHGFRYHKDALYTADDKKVVTGVMISGSDLKVIPSRELEVWESFKALGDVNEADRLKAIDSLIGKVSAFSQIDARYLARVQAIRRRRQTMNAGAC